MRNEALKKVTSVADRYRNRLFAFSVDPLSRVLIDYAWSHNPYNRYIDFGSTLDQTTKNKRTRAYQSDAEKFQDPTYIVKYNTVRSKFQVDSVH